MEKKERNLTIPTPKEIYEHLNEHVIGQDEAKKVLSVAVYNHYKRLLLNTIEPNESDPFYDVTVEKSNILLLGDTGTGKTYLIKTIAKYLGVPCYISDSTKLSATGYVGDDVENVLVGLLRESNYNIQLTEMGIVVLDEVDKIATKSENPSITRDVSGECVQQGLLKIVEGGKISVPPQGGRKHPQQECIEIDTTNILFIGLGAFAGIDKMVMDRKNKNSISQLRPIGYDCCDESDTEEVEVTKDNYLDFVETEDLRKYGMVPEFLGRFPILAHTNPLKSEDLVKILTEPKNSIIKQYKKLLSIDGITLDFSKEALKTIAEVAINNKTGARGLRKIIEKILTDVMFEYGGSKTKKKVKIDNNFIKKFFDVPQDIIKNKKVA